MCIFLEVFPVETGRHDIAEIFLKAALKRHQSTKSK
jgi:hypothetical protein